MSLKPSVTLVDFFVRPRPWDEVFRENPMTAKNREFDRDTVEDAVAAAIASQIGSMPLILESRAPGLVAISRLYGKNSEKLDWQEAASEIARATGLEVVCVANCDWSVDSDCDEKATLVAFDVAGLAEGYRNDSRNEIVPVSPETAPSSIQFRRFRRVKEIVAAHIAELEASVRTRALAQLSTSEVSERLLWVEEAYRLLEIDCDQAIMSAVETLDFDHFLELSIGANRAGNAPRV